MPTFLTSQQLLGAGCVKVTAAAGPYNTLMSHPSFPGLLIKVVTTADDLTVFRGVISLDVDGVLTVGAGQYRSDVENSLIGLYVPQLKFSSAGDMQPVISTPLAAPLNKTRSGLTRGDDADRQFRAAASQVGIAMLVVPVGDVVGISIPDSVRSTLVPAGAGPGVWAMAGVGDPGANLTATHFNVSGVKNLPRTSPGINIQRRLRSAMIARSQMNLPGGSPQVIIESALARLAERLPSQVSSSKRSGWLNAAISALPNRPGYLLAADSSAPKIVISATFVDGERFGTFDPAVKTDILHSGSAQSDPAQWGNSSGARAGFSRLAQVNDQTTLGSGKYFYTTDCSLFKEKGFLWNWTEAASAPMPSSIESGSGKIESATVLRQTLVLAEANTGAAEVLPSGQATLDGTSAPVEVTAESLTAARELRKKYQPDDLYDLWLRHGAITASIAFAMVEADEWLTNQSS